MAGIKFGLKVKIVESYEKLFTNNYHHKLRTDQKESIHFWNEFFLLKANPVELDRILRLQLVDSHNQLKNQSNEQEHNQQQTNTDDKASDSDVDGNKKEIIDYLFDESIRLLDDEKKKKEKEISKLKQLNSLLTIFTILEVNLKLSKRTKENLLSDQRIKVLNSNLLNLLELFTVKEDDDYKFIVIKLILRTYLCLVCKDDDLNDNQQIDFIICDQLFDQLFKIIGSRNQELNQLSISLLTIINNYQNNDLFTIRMSLLDNEIALNSYAQCISKKLFDFNLEYRRQYLNQQNQAGTLESFFSVFTGLVLSNQKPDQQQNQFEQALLHTDHRCMLLALFDLIHLNRNFIPFLLTNHHSFGSLDNQSSIKDDAEANNETNNLLINFLEFCSITIFCLKEYAHKGEQLQKKLTTTTRLCFIILTCIGDDQYANSIMHDSTSNLSAFKVAIYRSRHRFQNHLNDPNQKQMNLPIAYSILDLLTEFLCSNLRKKQFQLDLYVFCNNIVLKLLCYQIKFEIRKEYNWYALWHSLISLLKYLYTNYDKEEDSLQIKRKSRLLLLANNVVNLFNLFIIFGDSFLFSPTEYDDLYYELLRNYDLFNNLLQLAKHHSHTSKKKDEKEAASKLLNSLDNIELIISHFTNKINESRKNDEILTEQEIRQIVSNNYDTLALKVKDGLDIYDIYNYEPEKQVFKKKVLKKVIEQIKLTCLFNLDELINDQQKVLQSILNC